jgi:hypothetical protein
MTKEDLHKLQLGAKVAITGVYARDYHTQMTNKRANSQLVQTYRAVAVARKEGVYIGSRSLQEGFVEYSEDSREWIVIGIIPCALVVTHPRKNPIRVPLHAIHCAE